MHEAHHVTYGVHGAHVVFHGAVVAEHLDGMALIHVVPDAVRLLAEAFLQLLEAVGTLGDVLDEVGYLAPYGVAPRRSLGPMAVEAGLHLPHLLARGLLGILLQSGVDGGVYLQSVCVEVYAAAAAPGTHLVDNGLAEVGGQSVVDFLHAVVKLYRLHRQRVVLLLGEMAVGQHILQHHVASLHTLLGVQAWIVRGGGLQHTHQHGGLLGLQL